MPKAALVSNEFVSSPDFEEYGQHVYGFVGNHDDDVPPDGMTKGSWFLEKDTKILNFFDPDNGGWAPFGTVPTGGVPK